MENHESDAAVAPINELPLAAEPAVISSSDEEVVEEEEEEEDASSEEGSDEAGSSSEDDEQPLVQRSSAGASTASTAPPSSSWAAKHKLEQPKPTPVKKRTRVNAFPQIPRSQRCGTCLNCLNPQRKKACETARKKLMQQQQQQQEQQQVKKQKRGGTAAAAAPPPPSTAAAASRAASVGDVGDDDPFIRSLTGVLSGSGGVVQERHLPLLLQLVKRAESMPHRTALLVVLERSAPEVQRRAVAGGVLLDLRAWLSKAVDDKKATAVQRVLACLDKLPVTLSSLQEPCGLGKAVGNLRKNAAFGSAVIEPAKRLVERWKALVPQKPAAPGAGSAKAAAGGSGVSAAGVSSAAATKPAAAVKPPAAAPAKAAAGAASTAAAVAAAAPTLDRQLSAASSLQILEDGDDLFKTADRKRASIKEAAAAKKPITIKTLPVEGLAHLPASQQAPAAAAAAGTSSSKVAPSAAAAAAKAVGPAAGPTAAHSSSDVAKVSASPFAALGEQLGGGGVTVLGSGNSLGGGASLLTTVGSAGLGARERAAAAARRVPSPEPRPQLDPSVERKLKKKVVWVDDKRMVGLRWFLKDDPPAAAKADADPTQPQPQQQHGAAGRKEPSPPPRFESAAKNEHLSEAAALRRHRAEEDEERVHWDRRLARMQPTMAWAAPPPNDAASDPVAPLASGEDSTEAREAASRRRQMPPAVYASAADVPESPVEPSHELDRGVRQHPAAIPRIPLSLEEAAAMLQGQQAPPASAPGPVQPAAPQALPGSGFGGVQQPAPMYRQQQQQQHPPLQQQQQQLLQQQQGPAAVPDIGVALAQLAASGLLSAGGGGTTAGGGGGMLPPTHNRPQGGQVPGPYPPMQQQQPHLQPQPLGAPGGPGWLGNSQAPPRPQQHQAPPRQQYTPSYGVCRFFNTPQGCKLGNRCKFAHLAGGQRAAPEPAGVGAKRHADGDGRQGYGAASKHARPAGWGGRH